MPPTRVLIVGAGVAGSVLAYFLSLHCPTYTITVIERSKSSQKLGQGIEIEEPALTVVREMGVLPALEERKTGEKGFELMDERGRSWGVLEVGGFSPTGALEIMRGDLCEVLWRRAEEREGVRYWFETTIRGLKQSEKSVVVELENRSTRESSTEEFDFVIGADGVKSRTREFAMGSNDDLGCMKPVGASVAYFSIPKEGLDWPYSRACQFPGRRIVWTRPISDESKFTSVYLIHLGSTEALRKANAASDRKAQKQAFAELYDGLGWEIPTIVSRMKDAENFYSDELAQVKLKSWSKGRVALVGDAAWAPTPFTGEGNQLAIIAGWVLAQEMGRDSTVGAFEKYEGRLRKYVEDAQEIPFGGRGPRLFVPDTRFGILMFRWIGWGVCLMVNFARWIGLSKLFPDGADHNYFDLQVSQEKAKKAD
jgi:2-polyprenyl-6-methoxyphenol hydroxylase-like FAD-dependent oxidoreductase